MDHPRPGLRYIGVDELDRTFSGFAVDDPAAEKLGKLEGFILDVGTFRPYYLVVDAGGWFRSKHFLLPIGHAALDSEGHRLVADVSKERVRRFPGFDLDTFETLTADEFYQIAQQIVAACCPGETVDVSAPATARFEIWAHYRPPTWWDDGYVNSHRVNARSTTGSSR
jgi:hypothetical protein